MNTTELEVEIRLEKKIQARTSKPSMWWIMTVNIWKSYMSSSQLATGFLRTLSTQTRWNTLSRRSLNLTSYLPVVEDDGTLHNS